VTLHALVTPRPRVPGRRRRPRPAATPLGVAPLVAVLALALAACSPDARAQQPDDAGGRTVLRYQGTVGQVALPELADDLGYFEDIELEWVSDVTGGPASIQATATGETDIGSAFNGAVIKLIAAGAPITSVISSYGSDELTFGGTYVLEDSPIRTARDLIGAKVGVNTLGAQHEAVTRSWLADQGLSADEIEQVELTVIPPVNAEQSLREGQLDAVQLGGILKDSALERGGLRELFSEVDLFGTFAYGTFVLNDAVIAEHPEAAADFVQGVARAIRWAQVTDAQEVRDRFVRIIEERGRHEDPANIAYWRSVSIPTPGGVVQEAEITTWIDWLVADGQVPAGSITPQDVYTNEYNPYADGTWAPDAGPDGEPVD